MFSLIIPVYNESAQLRDGIAKIIKEFKRIGCEDYEIIVTEDGSTDGTEKIALGMSRSNSKIRLVHFDKNIGRGFALKQAFLSARGDVVGYTDIDLATDISHLKELLDYCRDYDIVTGSRYLPGAYCTRPKLREDISKAYNWITRNIIGCNISDLQCGFKAFSKEFVQKEISGIKEGTWAWDTIVLVEGYKKGYRIKEFPVKWLEKRNPSHSASIGRIYKDIKKHGHVLIKLFLKWRLGMSIQM